MNHMAVHADPPLFPEDVALVHRVYEMARRACRLSRHDVEAQRLAAMAVRFYQLGIRDDQYLLSRLVRAHQDLHLS